MFLLNRFPTLLLLPYGPSFMWFPHLQLEGVYYGMWCNIGNIVFSCIYLSCAVRYIVTIVCCPSYIYRRDGYRLYMPFNQLQLMLQLGEYILGFFKLNLQLFLEKKLIHYDPCRTSPCSVDGYFCLIGSWESPPSIWLKVTRKPRCTGLVRNSRVRTGCG